MLTEVLLKVVPVYLVTMMMDPARLVKVAIDYKIKLVIRSVLHVLEVQLIAKHVLQIGREYRHVLVLVDITKTLMYVHSVYTHAQLAQMALGVPHVQRVHSELRLVLNVLAILDIMTMEKIQLVFNAIVIAQPALTPKLALHVIAKKIEHWHRDGVIVATDIMPSIKLSAISVILYAKHALAKTHALHVQVLEP